MTMKSGASHDVIMFVNWVQPLAKKKNLELLALLKKNRVFLKKKLKLEIEPFGAMNFSIMTIRLMTFRITTHSIKTLIKMG